jgi:YfiH family protein
MEARAVTQVEANRSELLGALPHGFLGRRGGVSTGELAGLNVGYGSKDDKEAIDENRRRAIDAVLPGAELATVHQIHSPRVIVAERAWPINARPHADAMITTRPGLLLGILTADCAPILFADVDARVIGAAHAGWRGALAGVTDATIACMEEHGADRRRIVAAVGPCIAQPSYEVDAAFRANFVAQNAANERFFSEGPSGKPHFDLEGYVVHRLTSAGIEHIDALHLDTYTDADCFYSYRRASHRGEADYGRQASLIALP